MSSSFAVEDPFRAPQFAHMTTQMKAKEVFKDMGKGMWKSGSGFARVGALYAGSECVIEGVRLLLIRLIEEGTDGRCSIARRTIFGIRCTRASSRARCWGGHQGRER